MPEFSRKALKPNTRLYIVLVLALRYGRTGETNAFRGAPLCSFQVEEEF
jgi:hypothetical protein